MSNTLGIVHLNRCSNGLLAQFIYIGYVYNITVNKYIYIYKFDVFRLFQKWPVELTVYPNFFSGGDKWQAEHEKKEPK